MLKHRLCNYFRWIESEFVPARVRWQWYQSGRWYT